MKRIHTFFTKSRSKKAKSWQTNLALSLGCFLLAFLFTQTQARKQQEDLAARLAPSVLRFHILADSDSKKDQQAKLEVRSLILDFLKENLPDYADKKDTVAYLAANREAIETIANTYLRQQGFCYQAHLQLTNCYFPARNYGSYVFPCGYYDAARITLGKGRGHNWWCILYPQFCFVDEACTGIPQKSSSLLLQELKQDDYLALKDNRPEIEIRFMLFPTFKGSSLPPSVADRGKP